MNTLSIPIPQALAVDDLAHDLRQPLSVIESLAYYLELVSHDEKVCGHVRHIQAMVQEANRILARSSEMT
ncbi:MAG: hypothetical protein JOZ62_03230 [Acidobacteriaceae bacterium]|nr:hypothetical protein [Acidobacteriaceae bacterium]